MRFYIASSIHNQDNVSELARVMKSRGHEHTYDWTEHGDIRGNGERAMGEAAFNELRAVRDAELVLVLLPGGAGTHTELGVAIATRSNKRIVVWSETGEEFLDPERTCTFYYHPCVERIVCPFEEFMRRLDREYIGSDI